MKVGLVIPPSPFLGDEKRNCPLGILYIAAVLEWNRHDVFVVDMRGNGGKAAYLPYADTYGFTSTTPEYSTVLEIAKFVSNKYASWIVIGGSHASAVPEAVDGVFDDIVVGEGETAISRVSSNVYTGYNERHRITNIDDIPFPARHLLPRDSVISNTLVGDEPATTMITSRGCAQKCSFCVAPSMWGRRVTYRSPDNVIQEIKKVMEDYDIRAFRFLDDNMTISRGRLFDLCLKMKPLDIIWRCGSRIDLIKNDKMLSEMKAGGCIEIGYGIETVCQNALDINMKAAKVEDMVEVIRATEDAGIRSRLWMIIGLPGEEKGIADRTIKFIQDAKPSCVMLATFVPFPGTDVYNNPEKYDVKIKMDYDNFLSVLGNYEGEKDTGFICEYEDFSEQELIDERARLLDYIEEEGLDEAK